MQNLNTTIDLPILKPIKKKSDEKLYQGKELRGRSSISDLQNDHFLSRKSLSSMNKLSNVEVYYGNAPLGVPFKWESQPGTPKIKILETPLPPLTPPPSFLEKKKNATRKQTKGKLLQRLFLLPKLNLRKSQLQSSPTSSSSSLSSSSFSSPPRCWSFSVPASPCRIKSNF